MPSQLFTTNKLQFEHEKYVICMYVPSRLSNVQVMFLIDSLMYEGSLAHGREFGIIR